MNESGSERNQSKSVEQFGSRLCSFGPQVKIFYPPQESSQLPVAQAEKKGYAQL